MALIETYDYNGIVVKGEKPYIPYLGRWYTGNKQLRLSFNPHSPNALLRVYTW